MSDCGHRWAKPRVILVATDLSDLDHLMPFAIEQASETGARLILLHVLASSAAMSVDAAGMPYYDTAGVVESARKSCWHGANAPSSRDSLRDRGARGPSHQSDCRRHSPVQSGPRSSGYTEPEQDWQVAHRLRCRTSAALGQPPGHNRGTRGSSPGGFWRTTNASCCMPPHLRETSRPSAALACSDCRQSEAQSWFCCTCFRPPMRWSARAAHGAGFAGHARAAQAGRGNGRGLLLGC